MIKHSDNKVKLHSMGEKLSKVLWQGRTWCVTDHGIERRDGVYHIRRDDLWRGWWPMQIAGKMPTEYDYPDFVTAWLVAVAMFELGNAKEVKERLKLGDYIWKKRTPVPYTGPMRVFELGELIEQKILRHR